MAATTSYADDLIAQLDSGVAVYEAVDDGADFVFVDINRAVEQTDHVRREALVGKRLTEVFPGVEEFGLLDVLRRVWRTGTPEVLPPKEYEDDRVRGWRTNRVYRLGAGYVVAVYEDVTQRMQAELALRASEDRYRLLTESSIDGIWDWNVPEGTLYLSPKWKAQLGFADDELENSFDTFLARLHPDDRPRVMDHLDHYLGDRNPHWEEEFRLLHKDGRYIWLLTRGTAVFDEAGTVIRMLGVHIDINRRKLAEGEAAVIRERLQATLELNQDAPLENENSIIQEALEQVVLLTTSRIGYCHFVNDDQQSIALVTWSRETLKACTAAFDTHYPLGEAGIWADCIRTRTPQVHNDYPHVENRKGLPDGHIGLTRHMSIPVLSGDKVRCVVGVGNKTEPYTPLDVEQAQLFVNDLWRLIEEKRTEDKLKQAAAVIANTQEAVTITDTTPRIVAVNEAFTTITGYSESEVVGANPNVLKSGRHGPDFYDDMWRQLTASGRWQGEIWNRRKSGEIFPEWLTITAIYDDSGLATHYAAVFSDISRLKQSEDRLEHLAHYDPLTGLPNRILLVSRIEHAMQRVARTHGRVAVLFLDLDNFKNVNDSLGHPAGDELLKSLARRLSRRVRTEDTVARVGGDEFVILVEDFTDDVHVAEIADSLINEVAKPVRLDGHEFFVGGSIGISLYPEDGDNVTDLIKNADAAMYLAKESGRNSFRFYTPQLTEKAQQRLRIESELRQAIRSGQIQAYFQPLARISDDHIVGAEALARWIRDGEEYLSPGRFIPIAEDAGLIDEISSTILEQACSELSSLDLDDDDEFTASINISPRQFHGWTLGDTIGRVLHDHGLPGSRFEFELTETVLMKDAARSAKQLVALKSLGASIAIDDFGTGFSSLAYLTKFPIDRLKIDRSFINRLQHSANELEIVSTILAMADKLGMVVIAEGVETATQLARLRELGCDLYQGYFLSRPVTAETLRQMLIDRGRLANS